jgi:cardiolipin synthase
MFHGTVSAFFPVMVHIFIQVALILRVLMRSHRDPSSRIAWIVVILALPVVGIISYILLGETNIGRSRVRRMAEIVSAMPDVTQSPGWQAPELKAEIPQCYAHVFALGKTINGFDPIGGNSALLMEDSTATINRIVADIDSAKDHVHLLFYIWLPDNNGRKIVEALTRAAARGVSCRALADDLGSRTMIRSEYWLKMRYAGVKLASTLPVGNPLLQAFYGRIDLRNHRKIVVIDNYITYCGSQNCADPEFLVKAKYAPWVDIMMRFEGPIAHQNQYLFASDWQSESGEDIRFLFKEPVRVAQPGLPAQVIGTGPTVRHSAMPEVFESLMYTARRELVISTPYFVPDDPMQAGLCASARRGVDTTIIFPARNDSWIVAAASRSYYYDLLAAGVRIFEYQGGLLHAKTLTLDGEISLIGSANMDRRSFELNYENNILFYDPSLTADLRQRQQSYMGKSKPVSLEHVENWKWHRRLWNNTIAMFGPVL